MACVTDWPSDCLAVGLTNWLNNFWRLGALSEWLADWLRAAIAEKWSTIAHQPSIPNTTALNTQWNTFSPTPALAPLLAGRKHARQRAVWPDLREPKYVKEARGLRRPEVDIDQHSQATGRVLGRPDGEGQRLELSLHHFPKAWGHPRHGARHSVGDFPDGGRRQETLPATLAERRCHGYVRYPGDSGLAVLHRAAQQLYPEDHHHPGRSTRGTLPIPHHNLVQKIWDTFYAECMKYSLPPPIPSTRNVRYCAAASAFHTNVVWGYVGEGVRPEERFSCLKNDTVEAGSPRVSHIHFGQDCRFITIFSYSTAGRL